MYKKVFVSVLFGASVLFAQGMPKDNVVPLGNVNGSTGNVFSDGKLRLVLHSSIFEKDRSYDGNDEVNDPKKRGVDIKLSKLVARYGLGGGFDVRVVVPYIDKQSSMTNPMNNKTYNNSNKGIGDITLLGRYELMSQKAGDPLFLALGLGVKFPTGDTDKKQTLPVGSVIKPGMQLGSGSTDIIFEVGLTKLLPNSRIDAYTSYKMNTKGDNNHKFGNQIKWNLGYSYALNKNFDIQLEIDGIIRSKDELNGKEVGYTGGKYIYATPGIHYRPNNSFDISLGYAYMIYNDNNFDSTTNTGGLSEDGKFIARFGYNF